MVTERNNDGSSLGGVAFGHAGAFWFGYALQDGQSWVAVAMAFGLCNFGSGPLSSIALTYITDAYNEVSETTSSVGFYEH